MTLFILLALLNGFCIALSRIWNGQLAVHQGAFKSSFINHIVGFLFLSLVLLILFEPPKIAVDSSISIYAGGFIGALYVAINSYVMKHLGVTSTMLYVISGQMCFGLLLDSSGNSIAEFLLKLLGVILIIVGVLIKSLIVQKPVATISS